MVSKTKAAQKEKEKEEEPEKEGAEAPDTPLPLLDLSDAAVKKLIRSAKKRGYVTHDQINSVLPSEEVNSEQIEDILAMFSEMGVNVVETEEATEEGEEQREEADEEPESEGGELVEVQQKVPAKSEAKEPTERTDDPVRMYLREMGSVELLSREGEIAIAKRIEAGREMMIGGICESPLTVRAMVGWRDALNENKMLLRDIVDLDATYGAANLDEAGAAIIKAAETVGDPDGAAAASDDVVVELSEEGESDSEEDGEEAGPSLAAMEAQLRPGMMAIFDSIAERHKKLAKIQDQRIAAIAQATQLPRDPDTRYDKLKDEVVESLGKVKFNNTRIEHLVEQLYELNRRLVAEEGRLLRLAETAGVKRADFVQHYMGDELSGDWLERAGKLPGRGWPKLVDKHVDDVARHRAAIAQIAGEAKLPI